jgi:acyl-CoA reductase-like NAD-dependent aldehyde dehydrogenase
MNPGLLFVDLQEDYLRASGLAPDRDTLESRATELLRMFRERELPVFHALTRVQPDGEDRMPHWKTEERWMCVANTSGFAPPTSLNAEPGEFVVYKRHYSAFESGELERELRRRDVDTLFIAGLHLHACVRASVLDAYQHGFDVRVIGDIVASDDPLHGAITARYLAERGIEIATLSSLRAEVAGEGATGFEHASPRDGSPRWRIPIATRADVEAAAEAAHRVALAWQRTPVDDRAHHLRVLADVLETDTAGFAEQLVLDVGKPIGEATAEVTRTTDLLRLVADTAGEAADDRETRGEGEVRRRPLGVIGMITPWNNPLAIPLGKIAPALLYGNTVVWKPAPPGARVASRFMDLVARTDLPEGVMALVHGDHATAREVMSDARIAAVTLSGSSAAGYAAQEICARRRIPLQAELGGNNAAIVWADADIERAAREIAHGAFGFAGQRCTANRRVVVDDGCYDTFVTALVEATQRLGWGDPARQDVVVGPVVTAAKRDELLALIARSSDMRVFQHSDPVGVEGDQLEAGFYVPPTIFAAPDPAHPIVQEETFGPVLVLQRASSWDEAICLANGVSQGLVAALFSRSKERQESFREEARAGILKINQATHGAGVELPFGGWKLSGVGPPEHGPGNREFYTRAQAVYSNDHEA